MTGASKASHAQMEKMLLFMKKNPVLVHGKAVGNVDRSMNHHLWQTLSDILNADGSGPVKPALKWQKSWIDWKSNTKKKYMRIKNHIKENDGTPCPFTLSKIEEKLVAFLYPESYEEDTLLSEACQQSNDNELEIQYEIREGIPETYAIEDVDVEIEVEEEEKISLQSKKKQKVLHEDLGEFTFQTVEKKEEYEGRRLELEERKLLLKERAIRDKERRTDIFDKAVRDKERRSEIYDRAVRDRERRSDIYDRSVRDKGRKTELLTRIVRDMERRTEIFNRTSVAAIKTLSAFTESLSNRLSTTLNHSHSKSISAHSTELGCKSHLPQDGRNIRERRESNFSNISMENKIADGFTRQKKHTYFEWAIAFAEVMSKMKDVIKVS